MENKKPLHKRKVGAAHFSEEASYDRRDYTTVGPIMQGYAANRVRFDLGAKWGIIGPSCVLEEEDEAHTG